MGEFARRRIVELIGLLTAAATVFGEVAIEQEFDWYPVSILVLGFVPIGAALLGALAASGYYVGSLLTQTRPAFGLRVQIFIVTFLAFFAIHYLNYQALQIDGRHISERMTYLAYLGFVLGNTRLTLSAAASAGGIPLGVFGYLLAVLQVAGFCSGGAVVFEALKRKPYCDSCSRFSAPGPSFRLRWRDSNAFHRFVEKLRKHPVVDAEYLTLMRADGEDTGVESGTCGVCWTLCICTACGAEMLIEAPQALSDGKWSDLDQMERCLKVPSGSSVLTDFHAAREAAEGRVAA